MARCICPLLTHFRVCFLLVSVFALVDSQLVQAGNRELMDEHVRTKRKVTEAVIEELKLQGKLPRDGVIDFEARVVQTPGTSKQEIKIDRLRVKSEQISTGSTEYIFGDQAKKSMDTALAPRNASGVSQKGTLPVPVDEKLSGTIRLKDGSPIQEELPPASPAPQPETPKDKNIFERLFGL